MRVLCWNSPVLSTTLAPSLSIQLPSLFFFQDEIFGCFRPGGVYVRPFPLFPSSSFQRSLTNTASPSLPSQSTTPSRPNSPTSKSPRSRACPNLRLSTRKVSFLLSFQRSVLPLLVTHTSTNKTLNLLTYSRSIPSNLVNSPRSLIFAAPKTPNPSMKLRPAK